MALLDGLLSVYKMSNGAYTTDSFASYTLTAGSSTQQIGGISGYCGSGETLFYNGNYGLTGTNDVTIARWVKFTTDITATGEGMMFFGSTLTTDRFIALDYNYNGGSRKIDLYASNNSITGSYTVNLGTTWHLLIVSRISGTVTVYLDNVSRISGLASTATGGQNTLSLGVGKVFGGTINQYYDECYVWNRDLTSDERTTLWNSGAGTFYPFASSVNSNFFMFFN